MTRPPPSLLIGLALLALNAIVLLGQLWPAGAPPFARSVNIACLLCNLAFIGHRLLADRRP